MIIDWTYYDVQQFNSYFGIGSHIYNYSGSQRIVGKMLISVSTEAPEVSGSTKVPGASFGTKVPGVVITGRDGDA